LDHFEVCIIGAGVIGLAIARKLAIINKATQLQILLLENESGFGQHTSSRNSEVIHAGIYYPQDSLKARFCVQGRELLYDFCREYEIPYRRLGKVIAAQRDEQPVLESIAQQAVLNGVYDLEWLSQRSLQKIEPKVNAACALFSPSSGIIDSHAFMVSLLQQAESAGVVFAPRTRVLKIVRQEIGFVVECQYGMPGSQGTYQCGSSLLINSAGLWAQEVAALIEELPVSSIPPLFPSKGSYFAYSGKSPFQHLIYPVPDAGIRSLGIHGTLDMSGQLKFGPNAEYVNSLDYRLNPKLKEQYVESISHYFPGICAERLLPAYAGVRPKLTGPGQGFADFMIQDRQQHGISGLIQLFGIESPGLTASLAIADDVAQKVFQQL
jgi:L-2-hydroxyglutarate oxidase LhgO